MKKGGSHTSQERARRFWHSLEEQYSTFNALLAYGICYKHMVYLSFFSSFFYSLAFGLGR